MSTRKHFIETANALANIADLALRRARAEIMASMFAAQNRRFDKARFLAACGL